MTWTISERIKCILSSLEEITLMIDNLSGEKQSDDCYLVFSLSGARLDLCSWIGGAAFFWVEVEPCQRCPFHDWHWHGECEWRLTTRRRRGRTITIVTTVWRSSWVNAGLNSRWMDEILWRTSDGGAAGAEIWRGFGAKGSQMRVIDSPFHDQITGLPHAEPGKYKWLSIKRQNTNVHVKCIANTKCSRLSHHGIPLNALSHFTIWHSR